VAYAANDLGKGVNEIGKGIERVSDAGLVVYDTDNEVVYIKRWFDFNPPYNPKHAAKIIGDIQSLPDCEQKTIAAAELLEFLNASKWNCMEGNIITLNTLSKGYKITQERVSATETETETYTETETETSKSEKDFFFSEETIKLTKKDYDKLFSFASHMNEKDFIRMLKKADMYYTTGEGRGKKWFMALTSWIEKEKPSKVDNIRQFDDAMKECGL
jgi:hypothetical protein